MITSPESLREAADRLHAAAKSGVPCAPIRDLLAADDVEAAYAAQEINTRRARDAGRRLVGRKIGLTSQRQLGVTQPDYGMLFSDMARGDAEDITLTDLLQPKVEAEIAYVLGGDLTHDQLTISDLLRAIDFAAPAIEIVGSRIQNWDIRITDTIVDNASSGLYVSEWFDIEHFPQAVFEATRFVAKGGDAYEALGHLTIRGVTKDVVLPFTLTIAGDKATAKGHLDLIRTNFGIGQGVWSSGQWVALEAGVDVEIIAAKIGS